MRISNASQPHKRKVEQAKSRLRKSHDESLKSERNQKQFRNEILEISATNIKRNERAQLICEGNKKACTEHTRETNSKSHDEGSQRERKPETQASERLRREFLRKPTNRKKQLQRDLQTEHVVFLFARAFRGQS